MPVFPFSLEAAPAPKLTSALDYAQQTAMTFTDTTINNVFVPVEVPDLTVAVEANAWYTFDSLIIYDSSTTADMLITFHGPGGTFWGLSSWGNSQTATGTTNNIELAMLTGGTNLGFTNLGGVGVGTRVTARPVGYVVTAAFPGSISMTFVQNPPEATNATIRAGSKIMLSRVF